MNGEGLPQTRSPAQYDVALHKTQGRKRENLLETAEKPRIRAELEKPF